MLIIYLETNSGGFFKTSISKVGENPAKTLREKEMQHDANLIEEGSECEDADLSKEIKKLEMLGQD